MVLIAEIEMTQKYTVTPGKKTEKYEAETSMSRTVSDLMRVVFLMGVVGTALWFLDDSNVAIFQSLLAAMFLVGGTHFTRRLLFHKLNLQEIALEAIRNRNGAAAAVFFCICLLLISIMHLSITLLR